jgi:hypothetical protein
LLSIGPFIAPKLFEDDIVHPRLKRGEVIKSHSLQLIIRKIVNYSLLNITAVPRYRWVVERSHFKITLLTISIAVTDLRFQPIENVFGMIFNIHPEFPISTYRCPGIVPESSR